MNWVGRLPRPPDCCAIDGEGCLILRLYHGTTAEAYKIISENGFCHDKVVWTCSDPNVLYFYRHDLVAQEYDLNEQEAIEKCFELALESASCTAAITNSASNNLFVYEFLIDDAHADIVAPDTSTADTGYSVCVNTELLNVLPHNVYGALDHYAPSLALHYLSNMRQRDYLPDLNLTELEELVIENVITPGLELFQSTMFDFLSHPKMVLLYENTCVDAIEKGRTMQKGQRMTERKSEVEKNATWIDGLMQYAIERQIGFETHQTGNIGINPERRNERTRELLRGVAELYGHAGETERVIKTFDDRLRAAQGSFGVELASKAQQRATVQGLFQYARDLAEQPHDTREQMLLVSDHLEDMVSCLSWDASKNGLYPARDWLDGALPRITAKHNILFTHIMLGPERGPAMNDFVGGTVTDSAGVADTCLYADLSGQYPEIETWPAICTVYRGGYSRGIAKPATELDLGIMRRYGDKFLDLEGISVCRFPAEVTVKTDDVREQSQQNTMQMGM